MTFGSRTCSQSSVYNMRASEACEPCKSTCKACEPFMRHDLKVFSLFLIVSFFFNVNYETNLFKGLCGVTPVFLVSRFSTLYSLRWLSVSLWQILTVLPAKDAVIYAGYYISMTLTAGWRIFLSPDANIQILLPVSKRFL